jgi:hypothetical protein
MPNKDAGMADVIKFAPPLMWHMHMCHASKYTHVTDVRCVAEEHAERRRRAGGLRGSVAHARRVVDRFGPEGQRQFGVE